MCKWRMSRMNEVEKKFANTRRIMYLYSFAHTLKSLIHFCYRFDCIFSIVCNRLLSTHSHVCICCVLIYQLSESSVCVRHICRIFCKFGFLISNAITHFITHYSVYSIYFYLFIFFFHFIRCFVVGWCGFKMIFFICRYVYHTCMHAVCIIIFAIIAKKIISANMSFECPNQYRGSKYEDVYVYMRCIWNCRDTENDDRSDTIHHGAKTVYNIYFVHTVQ